MNFLLPPYLSLFSTLVLPRPEVVITPDGSTTAGDVYTLTCSARVVENLAVEPDIQWLYTNGTTVGGGNITVGAVRMTGNMFTRNLTFNPLHTSHGGKYICNTSINVSAISLIGISNESSLDVTVQSKKQHKSIYLSTLQFVHIAFSLPQFQSMQLSDVCLPLRTCQPESTLL